MRNNYCVAIDLSNCIMYIDYKQTETLTAANWKKFKTECVSLFGINIEKRICKQIHGVKYNRTYQHKKKVLNQIWNTN